MREEGKGIHLAYLFSIHLVIYRCIVLVLRRVPSSNKKNITPGMVWSLLPLLLSFSLLLSFLLSFHFLFFPSCFIYFSSSLFLVPPSIFCFSFLSFPYFSLIFNFFYILPFLLYLSFVSLSLCYI